MNQFQEQPISRLKYVVDLFRTIRVYLVLAILSMLLALISGWADVASAQEIVHSTPNQPARVFTDVSKSVVQVAEPFKLEIKVTAEAGTKIFFPALGKQLGDFDIIEQHDVCDIPEANGSDEHRCWTRCLSLESIVTGDLEIPEIEIQFAADDATGNTIKTKSLPIRVVSVLEDRADLTQFRDIRSVVDVAIPKQHSNAWLWWSLGGLCAAAMGFAAITVVARRKKYLTPRQWAIGELRQLVASAGMQNADAEPVLREMSTILRDYLELQFEFSAPAQTTQEFLQFVKRKKIVDVNSATRFSQLLLMADQAKFAGLQLKKTELQQVVESASSLIDCVTLPPEVSSVSEGESGTSQQSNDSEASK